AAGAPEPRSPRRPNRARDAESARGAGRGRPPPRSGRRARDHADAPRRLREAAAPPAPDPPGRRRGGAGAGEACPRAPPSRALSQPRRIVVGISGASGAIYGIRALEVIRQDRGIELHAVVSAGARATIEYETDRSLEDVAKLADI